MCIVISVVLAALSLNFFLDGFYLQGVIMAAMAIGLAIFIFRGAGCPSGGCKPKLNKEDSCDN